MTGPAAGAEEVRSVSSSLDKQLLQLLRAVRANRVKPEVAIELALSAIATSARDLNAGVAGAAACQAAYASEWRRAPSRVSGRCRGVERAADGGCGLPERVASTQCC